MNNIERNKEKLRTKCLFLKALYNELMVPDNPSYEIADDISDSKIINKEIDTVIDLVYLCSNNEKLESILIKIDGLITQNKQRLSKIL